ncbi:hypothetical protein C8J27_101623 [Rhodobacter aestuarii]|uniref:Uncharacterized protein n=1 Tax=Rhodobacter aestuarii TaxID=453582 RepID=A0A1N7IUR1_9RHOB|nr:hypothetical protein C8J27_101623 [Rhodobacter aestuarii]SIS40835.1 hypothetical protein SAMN05421580_10119 [Rhodobacter aestuarii]
MTTAYTRLYADDTTACGLASQLTRKGKLSGAISVVMADGSKRATLVEALKAADVHVSAVVGSAERLAGGAAALVAKVSHKPLGAAKLLRSTSRPCGTCCA